MKMTKQEIKDGAPSGATHYEIEGDDVCCYAKDYMGRWCAMDDNGDLWPMSSGDHERYDNELKPL